MRVLIHGINYRPELTGIGKYTSEMAQWLARSGHEVRVVTALPYYPSWVVEKEYSTWQYRHEYLSQVSVWRCPLWVPKKPTAFKRLLHLASFAITSFPCMMAQVFWKPDVVLTIEPPLFTSPQAWLTARLSGAKAWLHVQDFEVEAFFGLGFGSSAFLKRILCSMEAWVMRRFDHVSTISQAMLNRIIRLNVPQKRTSLLPNWVDTKDVRPNPLGRDLRVEWGFSPDQKIILYSGNMGRKQGLEVILNVASLLEKTYPETVFLLVGDGAAKDSLVEQAQKRRLNNVVYKPLQPSEDLPSLLAMADLHVVIQKRGAADAVMPSKLTGILAAGGLAVITADANTELGRLVTDNPGIAVLVEPENKEALRRAIIDTLSERASKQGSRFNAVARSYAEQHLATDIVLRAFENRLLELSGARQRILG